MTSSQLFVNVARFNATDQFKALQSANTLNEVAHILRTLTSEKARAIGQAAYKKVLSQHTYEHRAALLQSVFDQSLTAAPEVQA
ncbi:MAG: glycosyltransferase family 1 protein [Flavobacterium sp.]|nr:MAG: glycosyltransferase family 1 protein [Flavobacterium sp.]